MLCYSFCPQTTTRKVKYEKPTLTILLPGVASMRVDRAMSGLGQKRTCAAQKPMSALPPIATGLRQKVMSALPPKADMCGANSDVRYGPIADTYSSFDNFVRNPEQR